MRGVACVIPGTLEIEGRKKASELISEVTGHAGGAQGGGDVTVSLFSSAKAYCRVSC